VLEELRRLETQLKSLSASLSPDQAAQLQTQDSPFWALNILRERMQDSAGSILFTGISTLPPGQRIEWQREHNLTDLVKGDWQESASALSAMGHPVRLSILQAMLQGKHTTAELQQLPDMGTSGQLYHHLRDLQLAGWVRQAGRNHYVIQETHLIPLLTVLAAVKDRELKEWG
jgi:DNA-binding HxlR family transcriptional regulator